MLGEYLMESIQTEIINLAITVLTVFAGIITQNVVAFLKRRGIVSQLQNNKEIVKIVVGAIEQTYVHLHGEEKFNLAKIELIKLMEEKKIKMSEREIDLLIESMVREMNEKIKYEIKDDFLE